MLGRSSRWETISAGHLFLLGGCFRWRLSPLEVAEERGWGAFQLGMHFGCGAISARGRFLLGGPFLPRVIHAGGQFLLVAIPARGQFTMGGQFPLRNHSCWEIISARDIFYYDGDMGGTGKHS